MGRVKDALLCNGCQHWLSKAQGSSSDLAATDDGADPASNSASRSESPVPTATVKTTKNMCGCVSKVDLVFTGFGVASTVEKADSDQQKADLPVHDAVKRATREIKKLVGNSTGKMKSIDSVDSSAEQQAACAEITTLLTDSKRDANEQDEDGVTALSLAAFEGLAEVVAVLVDNGAELDHRTLAGLTALMLACHQGNAKAAEVLLENGATVDLFDFEGWSAMMTATSLDCVPCIKVLLQHGADINQPTCNGDHHTPIMVASQNGFVDSVKFLVEKGAALEHKDTEGMTALMRATHENKAGVVKLLLDAGAHVEARNLEGMSALMWAAYEGHCESESSVAALLLRYGADIAAVDQYGEDALALAQQRGFGPQMLNLVKNSTGKGKSLFQQPVQKGNGAEASEVPA